MIENAEECPVPMLGPSMMKKLGKPTTVVPMYPRGLPLHASARRRPPTPQMRSAMGGSVTWKPVPKTIASSSEATLPSAPTTARGRISAAAVAWTCVVGCASAG